MLYVAIPCKSVKAFQGLNTGFIKGRSGRMSSQDGRTL